ncbi:MexE family multidrug efflux RND transporter periplasmic adaptor subunit [Devosia yakushimensis]|uniref:MexE family multidrug efflux RND transporter periplasmic adaptor subunit n=1 Tax=Devosia yakushimensis TaxID=470028 RepID=A0ABQ5UEM1_9HYPH|nr:efflux RND transporter periplasmic adaptor subunit [Devosia yakushimensis]GLQ10532.1 MexE family multidrug efflux RND transporter periplasmic adaptor subunit [Devosia yakushimensis]
MNAISSLAKVATVIGLLAFVAACTESNSAPQTPGAPPPMPVSFVEVAPEQLAITNQLPGRIAPTRIAQVRPRVSGIVVERVFEQGSFVNEGDVLYRIDPVPFQLKVESAQASYERAMAVQLQASQQATRALASQERNIGTAQNADAAEAALASANADVALAEVAVAEAKLNLEYAEVKAPISGRIGGALITEGALVSAGSGENLAIIQQLDPVYADFTQPSNEMLRLRKALEDGRLASLAPGEASVTLLMDDDTTYAHAGRLLFSGAAVDAGTGQVTLRAEIPNPDDDLLPGMYVRVLLDQGVEKGAFAVPQQAIQRDAGGQSQLYVIGADNVVELRTVTIGRSIGSRSVVESGLNSGDRVVVEGVQKIRPGSPVAPEPWTPPATTAAAPATETPAS